MADAAARQLQYEYKAVRIIYILMLGYLHDQETFINMFYIYRILILFYKLMFDLLKGEVEMRLLVKSCPWWENYQVPKWVTGHKELDQVKLRREKLSKLVFSMLSKKQGQYFGIFVKIQNNSNPQSLENILILLHFSHISYIYHIF